MTEHLAHDDAGIVRAAELLAAGELVAFPTETVYGLGADATQDEAVRRLYEAKGRPSHNPLIVHVPGAKEAAQWTADWPEQATRLAERLWPGPLTLVMAAAPGLSPRALAGGDTVGVRAPDHPVAQALLRRCGRPIAAPSANRSGHVSPTKAAHVIEDLEGRIAAVLDGGACPGGIESTVLDCTHQPPCILRPGLITPGEIATILGLDEHDLIEGLPAASSEVPLRSPGLLERHYAPGIPLRLVLRAELSEAPEGVARVWLSESPASSPPGTWERHLPGSPWAVAARLYATLREAEKCGAKAIWVEEPPDDLAWWAVRDRLRRAAVEFRGF